jgi:uncharacterized protein with von Willebrand factor type A (vWA) domain
MIIKSPVTRTHLPDGFEPAHPAEIELYCRQAKVSAVAPAFFQDLLNIARGGEQVVLGEDEVEEQVNRLLREQPLLDRKKLLRYHLNVRAFLQELAERKTLDTLPGTALERAAALLKMLAEKAEQKQGDDESDLLPIFLEKDGEELGEETAQLLEAAQNLDEIDEELLQEQNPGSINPLSVVEVAERISQKAEWELVRLSHCLDELVELKTSKKRSRKPSPLPTPFLRSRGIRDLAELPKVNRVAHGLPDEVFWQRAVERRLPVREFVALEEHKQLIYMLLDCSGSMSGGKRIIKAGGILLNRVKAVIRGEAEIYLRLYEGAPHERMQALTPDEGRQMLKFIRDRGIYGGGSTNHAGAIDAALADIAEEGGQFHRCDVVLVTDGDSGNTRMTRQPGETKVHVFSVACDNPALRSLATSSGGIYYMVDDDMKLRAEGGEG